MGQNSGMSRRALLQTAGAATVGVVMGGCGAEAKKAPKALPKFKNADFYDKDGKFIVEKGKQAYIELMEYHGYPVTKNIREGLWVSDYGTGQFTKLGLGAIGYLNEHEGCYLGQDLFLLPNQMLPEHYHMKTDAGPAKLEGWYVRHGISYTYGEGEETKDMKAVIPEFEKKYVSVKHETILKPGQVDVLKKKEAHHWQFGGPEGAILTECGSYHDNKGVVHSDTTLVFP